MNTAFFLKQGTLSEVSLHTYTAEASELGFPPGVWPEQIPTDMGNGMPFVAEKRLPDWGVRYVQCCGCLVLDVFND